ncbi:phage tail tip lysozyme [Paracoccus litorisediminis]|uniref:Phage tail lysozyme domain-containing protein n=1 Tax=Paracoccus litorisediminis TaxID=2006130 RepID=A0A844HER7_9RHOB|nr:phage tail tip lysozyme [Paracoccus litorisediminis]MTH57880.1 hypothetical protein [Paracoccus litorisediminis]
MGYIFGGNAGNSYEDMRRQRWQAQQLAAGMDDLSGPGAGINALAHGLAAGVLNRRANAAERQGVEQANAAWGQVFGNGAPAPVPQQQPPQQSALGTLFSRAFGFGPRGGTPFFEEGSQGADPQQSAPQQITGQAPQGDLGSYLRNGLVSRGLPEHVADGFLMNFQDESGMNPGINEQIPTVAGSRGGYGLAQWTGPRRVALERFAQEAGQSVSDPDVQMDFLVQELRGPESAAARKILATSNPGEAGAAVVNSFLRPAEQHRASREAEYLGGAPSSQGQMPATGMDADMAAMAQLMGNPYLDEGRRSVLGMLMQHRFGQQNALWEQQMAAQDPLRQMEMEKAQLELDTMRNPQPKQTDDMREYDFAKSQGYQGSFQDFMLEMKRAGASQQNVTVGQNSSKFTDKSDELAATRLGEVVTDGQNAGRLMGDLQSLAGLAGQINTGKSAELAVKFGPYAEMLGVNIDGLPELQAYQSIIDRLAPAMRTPGAGASSDFDAKQFLSSLPTLARTPEGNAIINETMQSIQRQKMAAADIAMQAQRGEVSWQDAERKMAALGNPYETFNKMRDKISDGTSQAPQVGELRKGYRFKGGDPADPNSWERQ